MDSREGEREVGEKQEDLFRGILLKKEEEKWGSSMQEMFKRDFGFVFQMVKLRRGNFVENG